MPFPRDIGSQAKQVQSLKPNTYYEPTNWEELKGRRLLIKDKLTGKLYCEWTLLEISPNGKVAKFQNEIAHCQFWVDLDGLKVMEVLPSFDGATKCEKYESRRAEIQNPLREL